jgi:hypothetical protein
MRKYDKSFSSSEAKQLGPAGPASNQGYSYIRLLSVIGKTTAIAIVWPLRNSIAVHVRIVRNAFIGCLARMYIDICFICLIQINQITR